MLKRDFAHALSLQYRTHLARRSQCWAMAQFADSSKVSQLVSARNISEPLRSHVDLNFSEVKVSNSL